MNCVLPSILYCRDYLGLLVKNEKRVAFVCTVTSTNGVLIGERITQPSRLNHVIFLQNVKRGGGGGGLSTDDYYTYFE